MLFHVFRPDQLLPCPLFLLLMHFNGHLPPVFVLPFGDKWYKLLQASCLFCHPTNSTKVLTLTRHCSFFWDVRTFVCYSL